MKRLPRPTTIPPTAALKHVNSYIRKNFVELSELPLDARLFNLIENDLVKHAGDHMPASSWARAGGGEANKPLENFRASNLLSPWLGFGKNRVAPESLLWHYQYLRDIDAFGLCDSYFESADKLKPAASDLLVADLGTILEICLIAPFLREPAEDPLLIVEVGGGYGRLAEAFLNVFQGKAKYALIDAVPASLLYAHEYLKRANPEIRIGSFYHGDSFDMKTFDVYICPIWHFDGIAKGRFDLAINIQSMQEMEQHHCDFYLNWFDSVLKLNGIAYLNNRRDHLFRGAWNFPENWECLLKVRTPRSWTRDFPSEIYRKGNRSYASENRIRETFYRRDLMNADDAVRAAAAKRGHQIY
ncbi:MAG TPA: putative sugar O-methyltransferase [Candidatus Sulfotelmatobacter sp.]|nr:putative sugar O-methyltransferase [Candidatus Sulfotelmatobacter sp.]